MHFLLFLSLLELSFSPPFVCTDASKWIMNCINMYVCVCVELVPRPKIPVLHLISKKHPAQEKIFFIWCRFEFRHTSAPHYFYRNDSFNPFSPPPHLKFSFSAMLAIVNRLLLSMMNMRQERFLSSIVLGKHEITCDFYRWQIHDRNLLKIEIRITKSRTVQGFCREVSF